MPGAYQRNLLAVSLALSLWGCRRSDDDALARRTEEFPVVSEGSASGVTSTLAAPGEAPPPLVSPPPLTDTNVDTTTSFTILDGTTATTGTDKPGTLADTLPQEREPRPRVQAPPRPRETMPQPEDRPVTPMEPPPAAEPAGENPEEDPETPPPSDPSTTTSPPP